MEIKTATTDHFVPTKLPTIRHGVIYYIPKGLEAQTLVCLQWEQIGKALLFSCYLAENLNHVRHIIYNYYPGA